LKAVSTQMKNLNRMLCLLLFVFIGFSTAHAGALLTDPLEKSVAPTKKPNTPIGTAVTGAGNVSPITTSAEAPQKMTCWQYGKLILEQTVVAPKDKVIDVRLLESPDRGATMQAFDFKNAFCFIK